MEVFNLYQNLYEVSSLGNIRSVNRQIKYRDGRVYNYKAGTKKPTLRRLKYKHNIYCINLNKDGKLKTFQVHRLVADNFIPNPQNKKEVNHKNGNPLDNNLKNLEWATSKENKLHAIKMGLFPKGTKKFNAILDEEKVKDIYESSLPYKEIAQKYGIKPFYVSSIKSGLKWKWLTMGLQRGKYFYKIGKLRGKQR